MTTIDHLPKEERSRLQLVAMYIANKASIRYGYQVDDHTKKVRHNFKNDILPKLEEIGDTTPHIKDMVEYFAVRSYGWMHLLYVWHLYQCNPNTITDEVFCHLMSGNLEDLTISYQEVMDQYGI